jgi:hypothetical protein
VHLVGRVLALAILGTLALSGCGGVGSGAQGSGVAQTYTIGGAISGLSASGLSIADGNQTVSPAANATSFVFATAEPPGTAYSVSVSSQPSGETCLLQSGSGVVGSANVTNIQLSCNANNMVGTAATGSPIAGSPVTLVDSTGKQITTKTDGTGQYALSTVGLTAPFLVSVVTSAASPNGYPAGTTFYGVSDQTTPTVINITPLTDLLIRDWYAAQSSPVDIGTAFAKPASNPPPTAGEAQLLNAAILDFVQPVLQQDGVDPVGLDFISGAFSANGQGLDAALGQIKPITYDSAGTTASLTIDTTSTTTQSTTVTASTGSLKVATTTSDSGSGAASSTVTSAIIPTSSAEASAVSGVQATLDRLSGLIQSKGSALQASDLAPFFDDNFLDGGLTTAEEEQLITPLAGAAVNSDVITQVRSYDGSNNLLGVVATLNVTQNGSDFPSELGYGSPDVGLIFKRESDGSWLLYGNQQEANARAQFGDDAYYPATGSPGTDEGLRLALLVPAASSTALPCSSAYASSATVFPTAAISATIPSSGAPVTLEPGGYALQNSGFSDLPGTFDSIACEFDVVGDTLSLSAADLPAIVGNTLSFSLNGGSPTASLARTISGYTTESLTFMEPSSHALSAAQVGQPLTVQWNPPATVSIYQVFLSGIVAVNPATGGEPTCSLQGQVSRSAGGLLGTITLPSTCDGLPITSVTRGPLPAAEIFVTIYGSHGELLTGTWDFN